MNIKKIIQLSFAALCVAGALCACSKDDVSGADVQDNSLAQNSSSSVMPGSSDSFDKNDFLAKFGNHKSGVPVINITSYKDSLEHFKRVDGSIDSVYTMVIADSFVDSINARETYNNIVDSILENAFVPIDEAASHSFRDVHVRFLGEDSMGLYIELYDGGVSCGFGRTHPENDDMLVSEFYSHGVEKTGDSLFVVRKMLSFDTSIVEQFKDECIAEGGSFGVNMVVIYPIYDEPLEQWPIGHKCSLRASLTDSVYKDPYWEKYISKVLDRCIVDFSDN